jgi:uncharacterized repeat protein (TIGR03803 family)
MSSLANMLRRCLMVASLVVISLVAADLAVAQPAAVLGDCKPSACTSAAITNVCQSLENTYKAIANCSPPSGVSSCPRGTVQVLQSNANSYLQELSKLIASCPAGQPQQQCVPVTATTLTTLHVFSGGPDGQSSFAGLLLGNKGSLFGTTSSGGTTGRGTVFELTPPPAAQSQWSKTVLFNFTGGNDGAGPRFALVTDNTGTLYGTTPSGGSGTTMGSRVFELKPSATTPWNETVLASFASEVGINYISAPVIFGKGGPLYGVTTGTTYNGSGTDNGTVFQLALDPSTLQWNLTTIYKFTGGSNGFEPFYALVADGSGALYGTTVTGGSGTGTVFKLTPPGTNQTQWTNAVLYRFSGEYGEPSGPLILDSTGALYGMTSLGAVPATGTPNAGIVFKLTPPGSGQTQWNETILHKFSGGSDGLGPGGALTFDKAGALYGATWLGGASGNGVVFRLKPPGGGQTQWNETVLYSFSGGSDGANPNGSLVLDSCGTLYGTTSGGGVGYGTAFQLSFPP